MKMSLSLLLMIAFYSNVSDAQPANYFLILSSSGKVYHNTGVFPDSFQFLYQGANIDGTGFSDNPLTQDNTVGNPAPSVSFSGSGHQGSNSYTIGTSASNLIFQADVMFTNSPTAEGFYISFRNVDSLNSYHAKYGPYYGGILVLGKDVGGIGYDLDSSPLYGLPSSANTWYNLEIRAIGSSL